MSQEKEIKFPLSKRQRTKFENDYELIFFKKPVHNISDEKLVEAVQANQSKIGSNAKNSQQQPPQEGTQNEGGQDGKGIEENGANVGSENPPSNEGTSERTYLNERFKELFGIEANENEPDDEIRAKILKKENENFAEAETEYIKVFGKTPLLDYSTEKIWALIADERQKKSEISQAKQEYFDLFGKKPLDEMTIEQILSANANEKARISEANTKKPKANVEEIKFNPATEMLIQRKGEKRVINKQTFQFIKNDGWEEVVETPSELLNK